MDEWADGRNGRWADGRANGRPGERTGGQTDEWMDGRTDGQTYRWMRVGGGTDGQMDARTDRLVSVFGGTWAHSISLVHRSPIRTCSHSVEVARR